MSTQEDAGTPLSLLAEEQQHSFRLLELPSELLALLTSKNAPTLQLKSSEVAAGDAAGHAVLCTPDKTFGIRQKNSSNTVYILQPAQDGMSPDGAMTAPELIGISKLESTLETLPAPTTKASTYIRQLLPILSAGGTISGQKQPMTKLQLLANIPLSDAECEVAFREQSAFTDPTTSHCLNPTAGLKIDTWHSILENSRANAVDLTSELDEDAVLSLKDGLEDLKPGLFEAIIHSVATTNNGRTSIDPDRLVRWVGLNKLGADAPVQMIGTSDFKTSWKENLPEKLRDKVDLALIFDHAEIRGNKWVKFKDDSPELISGAKSVNTSATAGSKRKWHDKFKPAKKAT